MGLTMKRNWTKLTPKQKKYSQNCTKLDYYLEHLHELRCHIKLEELIQ